MGITVAYRGTQPDAARRAAALESARRFATDMQWHVENVEISPEGPLLLGQAVHPGAVLKGLSLRPHFACETLPLVFLEPGGELVDVVLQQKEGGDVRASADALVKTQFAGFAVHREVCDFLQMLRDDHIPDLEVEDESGWFTSRDDAGAEKAFAKAWADLAEHIGEWDLDAGDEYEVAGELFRREDRDADRPPDPEAALPPELRHHFEELRRYLATRYGGFGLDLDGSESSLENLDLLMTESDAEGWGSDVEDPDTEVFAHALGAYFGSWVATHLGGHWETSEETGPRLFDVAGIGLVVDPFQIAADRLLNGPAFSFAYHVELFVTLKDRMAA